MIVTLDIKTGDVLGVRDSPEIPIGRLAAMFANRTKKIWEAELGKEQQKGVRKCETQQSSGAPSSMKI